MKIPREVMTITISLMFVGGGLLSLAGGYIIFLTKFVWEGVLAGGLIILLGSFLISGGLDQLIDMIRFPRGDTLSSVFEDYAPADDTESVKRINQRVLRLILKREEEVTMLKALLKVIEEKLNFLTALKTI